NTHNGQSHAMEMRNAGAGDNVQQARPVNRTPIGRTHQNPLIGRDFEVEELRRILLNTEESTHASTSSRKKISILPSDYGRSPQCAVLVGEAGIGKTRLAEELSREVQQRGWTVAWSRVYAQESSVPFRQWTEVLRNAMTHGLLPKQEISRQPLVFQPLSALLPEMHALLPQVTFPVPLSPEQEQLRLWEATLALLVTISERTPLLLVLDDFHWADVSSCELFAYLVRRLHGHPIAIIGTYRDNELPTQHPLRSLLTALQREQVLAHLQLQPLTKEQIARLVAHLPQPVVQHIQNQSAGNPFFAEELARGLTSVADPHAPVSTITSAIIDASQELQTPSDITNIHEINDMTSTLPDTIAAVLELRMGRLSAPCQRLLGNAAVIGGSFEFTTIARMEAFGVNPTDEDTILDLIEEALQAGIITEEGTGTHVSYHFWHPLLASHLYDKLSAARRANLHRRAANVLQQVYRNREEEGAATITHHLVEGGGDSQNIIHYAELAGNHAYALSAYPEAERYYRIAATHLEEMNSEQGMAEGEHERLQMAYLLERLGECTKLQGKDEEARNFYERVLKERERNQEFATQEEYQYEAQIQALLWCEIGWTWYGTGNLTFAQQCCTRGETILHDAKVETGTAWASIRFQQSYIFWQEGKDEQAQQFAQEALKLFKGKLEKQDHQYIASSQLTVTKRTLEGHPVNLGRTYTLLGTLAIYSGQPAIALTHFNAAITLFEQYNCQREIANVCCNIGDIHLRKTEHVLAQSFFRRALHLAEQVGDIPLISVIYCNLGEVAARFGSLLDSEKFLKQGTVLAEQINEYIYMNVLYVDLAIVSQDQNKLTDAAIYIGKALNAGRRINNTSCIALALVALGNFRIAQATNQNGAEAYRLRLLLRAKGTLEHALQIEGLDVETKLKGELALTQVLFLSGELESALQLARHTYDDAIRYELTWGRICTQRLLGSILEVQGQQDQADEYFEQAIQAFSKYAMRLEYARTLHTYGLVLLNHQEDKKQNHIQGIRYLQEAQQIFSDCYAALDLQLVERVLHTITHANT
ncbi:MAG: AAA family ATPase, partial [Ktedonobacteraceae bacterium]